MSLDSSKTLGGIGALLVAAGCVVPLLSIIGIILVMVAVKSLAEYYNENAIFQNALYGIILYIIAIIAAAVVLISSFISMFVGVAAGTGIRGVIFSFIGVILALIFMFIFYLLGSIFLKKSFNILSVKTGEKMFDTAGLLILVGAVLTIIIIGIILMLVAWILVAVAFFSIKTSVLPPPPSPSFQ